MRLEPRATAGLLALLALLAGGCDRPRRLTADEVDHVCWYVEDVAHGVERDHRELEYTDGSRGLERIAGWARGTRRDRRLIAQPQPLRDRLERWPGLAAALSLGQIACDSQGHLVFVEPTPARLRAELAPALQAENLDRDTTGELILRLGNLRADSLRARRLVASLVAARQHHARAVGGKTWPERSESNSANAATRSTSAPGSSPGPDR